MLRIRRARCLGVQGGGSKGLELLAAISKGSEVHS